MRPPRITGEGSRRLRRTGVLGGALIVAGGMLAACGAESGPPELIWYINPDSGGQAKLAEECSTDEYTISTQVLPQDASQQRVQLVRRLAAGDTAIDLMSLDPPFTAEFAAAGYLEPLPDDLKQTLNDQSFQGATDAATWEGDMVVAPFWSNTQVLWYRQSFADQAGLDMSQPVTWQQLIEAANANGGKIGVQANKYEGYVVWVNALIAGAGGAIIDDPDTGADAEVTIDGDGGQEAAAVIEQLAGSDAAPNDLSVSNEGTAVATFGAEDGSFQVNWTFVWTAYGDDPVADDIGYAMYPRTVEDQPAAPPYGGIAIGVNDATEHSEEAMAAVACITSPDSQAFYGIDSGNMPASAEAYDILAESPDNPFPEDLLQLFQDSVDAAAPRTVSPYWSDVSSAIQSTWHPPSGVDSDTPAESKDFITEVLDGRRLL